MKISNIANGMLNYEQLKTGKTVILPVSSRLLECLQRNGGIAPQLSQQKFNEAIKRACKKIGMTEKLHISKSRGSSRVSQAKERWELVSSHTARRTGATILYLSGVPAKRVMLCTGHTTERVFLSYIKVSREENARMLADNAFFQ
jgi:integrase